MSLCVICYSLVYSVTAPHLTDSVVSCLGESVTLVRQQNLHTMNLHHRLSSLLISALEEIFYR